MTYLHLSMRSGLRETLRPVRVVAGVVALFAAVACDNRPSSSNPDSVSTEGGPRYADSVATSVSSSGWDVGAGPFVVLPTVDGGLMAGLMVGLSSFWWRVCLQSDGGLFVV